MQSYIPIVTYKLPGDEKWTAEALGLSGVVADGSTQAEAKASLTEVLPSYISMLEADDALQVAELDYVSRLTAPPEGVEWILLEVKPVKLQAEVATAT